MKHSSAISIRNLNVQAFQNKVHRWKLIWLATHCTLLLSFPKHQILITLVMHFTRMNKKVWFARYPAFVRINNIHHTDAVLQEKKHFAMNLCLAQHTAYLSHLWSYFVFQCQLANNYFITCYNIIIHLVHEQLPTR